MKTESLTHDTYTVSYPVGAGETGVRLDAFLKSRYRKRSREELKRAIEDGAILVERNQSPHLKIGKLKPSSPLIGGDVVKVVSIKKPEPPVSFDYKIIFEDSVLTIVDKPPNLPVHPAGRYFFNTLLIHLRTHGHVIKDIKAEREYFLAHRIDKETSGILVLTKTSQSCAHIVKQFAERETKKTYLAIARGETPEHFTIDAPLMRDPHSIIGLKMRTGTLEEGAQSALTEFKRISVHKNQFGTFSLVECYPKTGRQHQIRVHLEKAGHPIVGDKLYGMPESESVGYYERKHMSVEARARLLLPRHALHAARLEIVHPLTEEAMSIQSDLPRDLDDFLNGKMTIAQIFDVQPEISLTDSLELDENEPETGPDLSE